jgi:murein DD-endopeptidase MepM/ murein hydrolase activator NlpD
VFPGARAAKRLVDGRARMGRLDLRAVTELRLHPVRFGNSSVRFSALPPRRLNRGDDDVNAGHLRTRGPRLGAGPRRALLGLALAVALTACGQVSGVHKPVVRFEPAVALSPTSSANGENGYPIPTIRYTVVSITKTKKVIGGGGPFYICPVQGKGFFSDDFGAPRYAGGFHLHAGNDVFAPRGTPIVAPFDGNAMATPNSLGGLAVKVYGRQGFVYNAHLVAYGKLGSVKAGTVIGYVGNTGDALGGPTHDHFEWHPSAIPAGTRTIGTAIDPYPFLKQVC